MSSKFDSSTYTDYLNEVAAVAPYFVSIGMSDVVNFPSYLEQFHAKLNKLIEEGRVCIYVDVSSREATEKEEGRFKGDDYRIDLNDLEQIIRSRPLGKKVEVITNYKQVLAYTTSVETVESSKELWDETKVTIIPMWQRTKELLTSERHRSKVARAVGASKIGMAVLPSDEYDNYESYLHSQILKTSIDPFRKLYEYCLGHSGDVNYVGETHRINQPFLHKPVVRKDQEKQYEMLLHLFQAQLWSRIKVLLYGNYGTGKTTMAYGQGKLFSHMWTLGADLVSGVPNEGLQVPEGLYLPSYLDKYSLSQKFLVVDQADCWGEDLSKYLHANSRLVLTSNKDPSTFVGTPPTIVVPGQTEIPQPSSGLYAIEWGGKPWVESVPEFRFDKE